MIRPAMIVASFRAWLRDRRRRRIARHQAERSSIMARARMLRGASRFIDSVLWQRDRKGYMSERQYQALRSAVTRLERGM